MKKNNNKYLDNCRCDREGALTRENPIHCYGEEQTITGRVYGGWRKFRRPGGSSQYVFSVTGLSETGKPGSRELTELELYVNADRNLGEVEQVLCGGRPLEIRFCQRYDVYIDRDGELAERSFLFINGTEDIQLLEDTAATA